jgi:mono/diheme cytochrome c family protein
MIESLRAQLLAAGVPPAQIHAEELGFAKLGRGADTAPAARITHASGETALIPRASAGCAACHTLAAAAVGKVGPNLDDAKPDPAHVADIVTHGKGGMPPYRGRLTDKQIRDVAGYVAQEAGA